MGTLCVGLPLKPELLQIFPKGCINLHPAYLPWNRGWYTNVWPILDGTPAGVTIHYIDPGVDTGDIIAQTKYPIEPTDTAGSLHQKLTLGLVELFKATWPSVRAGKAPRVRQDHSLATVHRKSELGTLDRIEPERKYVARELLNLLRARTYPPYPAAFFEEKGNRVYVRVELEDITAHGQSKSIKRIDLDGIYPAGALLNLLTQGADVDGPAAVFSHDSREIGIRARYVREGDCDPSANPAWMTASQA